MVICPGPDYSENRVGLRLAQPFPGERDEFDNPQLVAGGTVTTTVLVSVGISAGVTLLLLIAGFLTRRGGGRQAAPDETAISRVVAQMTSRMDAMGRELTEALERTQEESRRNRALGELAGTIDLDEVLNRTLDAAGALPNVDAALLNVIGPNEEPVTTAIGISPEEAEEYGIGQVRAGRRIRSLILEYGDQTEPAGDVPQILAGLAVPIPGEPESLGLLSVFSRTSQNPFDSVEVLDEIEALALRAGPAIENASRFREARHQADLDALTGLHNRRYFHETLARETARAQRYNRRLALIVFDLDEFKAINDRIGHLAGDSVLADVAERVRDVVRHVDIACRVGGDEFAVVLPESTLAEAEQLYRRIQSAVSSRPISHAGQLLLSAGIAELRAQDDPVAFFQRADDALYRAKEGGKGRVASESAGVGAPPLPPAAPPYLGAQGQGA
jgi:diguanylate cyclase (GGDEF)-like protein